jgi:tellurite methyltransferase
LKTPANVYTDKLKWDDRYRRAGDTIGPPSPLVVRWAAKLAGPVLDVAGGNGRNARFLAEHGLEVHVIDISLAALQVLARQRRERQLRIFAVAADLDQFPLPRCRYGTVLVVRYLQRSLFSAIKAALRPGGLVLYESFIEDQKAFGHPSNPAHLLRRGELKHAFSDFELLEYEEGLLEDTTPAYLARLVARRPFTCDTVATP